MTGESIPRPTTPPAGPPARSYHGRRFRPWDGRLHVLAVEVAPAGHPPWLAFFAMSEQLGAVAEHRRLTPVPPGWRELDDVALEALYAQAADATATRSEVPVRRPGPPSERPSPPTESLSEELEFARAQLAAANEDRARLRHLLLAAEEELAATYAELATLNTEIQALYADDRK